MTKRKWSQYANEMRTLRIDILVVLSFCFNFFYISFGFGCGWNACRAKMKHSELHFVSVNLIKIHNTAKNRTKQWKYMPYVGVGHLGFICRHLRRPQPRQIATVKCKRKECFHPPLLNEEACHRKYTSQWLWITMKWQ